MSHKVEMGEVLNFTDHVDATVSNVRGQLILVQGNMELIGEMDSFKGKTAKAVKAYLNDFHNPVIATFDNLFESLERNLKKQVDNFQSYVDSSDSALIESNYLNDNLQVIEENQRAIIESFDRVKSILSDVSDISSVRIPATLEVNQSFTEVIASIQKLEQRLSSFTNEWEGDHSQIKDLLKYLETTLSQAEQMTGEARYSELSSSLGSQLTLAAGVLVGHAGRIDAGTRGYLQGRKMYLAGKDLGLSVIEKNGHYKYQATEEALKRLGIEPDAHARNAFNQKTKSGIAKQKWKEETRLKYMKTAPLYYENHKGKVGWSVTGQNVLKKHPELAHWNPKKTNIEKTKTIVKETLKGTGKGFVDIVDVKSIASSGVVNGLTKSLAPLGAGLNFYTNYHDAKSSGVVGKEAVSRAVVDTTIDTAVAAGIQTGLTVLGTVAFPIPGVGTAIGAVAGAAVNTFLNIEFGKGKKSGMDRIKGWFH